jgi:UDP-N-acetylmuramate dehydrogenase
MSPAYTLAENASLAARNGFRAAARADLLADVRRVEGLAELLQYPLLRTQPILVLGEGSNILFAGDWNGVVLSMANRGLTVLSDDGESVLVRAEAGERWDDLVRWSLGKGLLGLENLSLIPGTVGAAPIQNIGAYGTEVGEFIEAVNVWDRDQASARRMPHGECEFGYRDSVFKREPERFIVVGIELRLPRQRELRIDYPGVREELVAMGVEQPRAPQLAEAICRLRTRKLPNPELIGNIGSFFKNPVLNEADAAALHGSHPDLPLFTAVDPTQRKASAAWMIEQCGWKGFREGDAAVSEQHALVLVNHGRATGAELLQLAQRIAHSVEQRFGIALQPEARIIGARFEPPA